MPIGRGAAVQFNKTLSGILRPRDLARKAYPPRRRTPDRVLFVDSARDFSSARDLSINDASPGDATDWNSRRNVKTREFLKSSSRSVTNGEGRPPGPRGRPISQPQASKGSKPPPQRPQEEVPFITTSSPAPRDARVASAPPARTDSPLECRCVREVPGAKCALDFAPGGVLPTAEDRPGQQ